jgi:hypothetical protein
MDLGQSSHITKALSDKFRKRRSEMNSKKDSQPAIYRTTAILVGALYIMGTVAGVLSVVFTSSILDNPDYLQQVAANQNQIILGALLVLTMGLSLALVPVVIFPVLKKHNEVLALGYLIFRGALETVVYIAMAISWLFLLMVSQEYAKAGAPVASFFQTLGVVLLKGNDSISTILIFVFGLGALMLYAAFYQSRLIPRWISVWGLIAILLHLATGFLILFNLTSSFSTLDSIMNLPIFLQEMVMAVWLIAKGFQPEVNASELNLEK